MKTPPVKEQGDAPPATQNVFSRVLKIVGRLAGTIATLAVILMVSPILRTYLSVHWIMEHIPKRNKSRRGVAEKE